MLHLGLPAVNTLDEFNAFGTPATIVIRPTDGSHWSAPGHVFGEVTAVLMSGTTSEQNYSYKTDFETRRGNKDFGRQNISMSRSPLDTITFGTNTTIVTLSPNDSIPVRTKTPYLTTLTRPANYPTRPTDVSNRKGKEHVPADPESDPSLSDSSLSKYDLSDDRNC